LTSQPKIYRFAGFIGTFLPVCYSCNMDVKNTHILIVDDDRDFATGIKQTLNEIGQIDLAHNETDFHTLFRPYRYDLVVLDLRLHEGKEGMELLEYIQEEDPATAVLVISGYGDIATAVEALEKGAKTFLEKGKLSLEEIKVQIEHTLKENFAEQRIRQLEASQPVEEIIGEDAKIDNIRNLINLVGQDGKTIVQIRGETGTGKELVARAIHRVGARKDGPFIAVSLANMNRDTVTSELFGHERGAFTGANDRHNGFFEQAHRGIIFLDEIGELSPAAQVLLLRVLEERSIRRMGGKKDIGIDVQVVTATNRPLEEMVKDGRFREDLYYRIKGIEIHLPPLRERRMDILRLARYFLRRLQKEGRTNAEGFSKNAEELLLDYRWPGNVRELKAVVESGGLRARLAGSPRITHKDLAPLLLPQGQHASIAKGNIYRTLAEQEMRLIEGALLQCGWKKNEAWKLLGYRDRFAMRRRVKKIIQDYPDLSENFPELTKSYS